MTISLVLTVILIAIIGVTKGIQDTLMNAWSTSVFARGGYSPYGYWGDGQQVWLRRFVNLDPSQGYVPALATKTGRMLLIPVWDGWHLLALVQVLCVCLIPVVLGAPLWVFPGLFVIHSIIFEIIFRSLR